MEVGYRRKIEDARSGMVTLGPEESFCPKCFGDMKVQKTRPRYIATIKYGCIDLRILTLVLIFILIVSLWDKNWPNKHKAYTKLCRGDRGVTINKCKQETHPRANKY